MASVLGAIAKAVKAIGATVKSAIKVKRTAEKLNRFKKGIVTAIIIAFVLVVAPIAMFMGAVTEIRDLICTGLFNWVSGGEEEVRRSMNDAYYMLSMLDMVKNSDDESISSDFYNLSTSFNMVDVETYEKILWEVHEYNAVFNNYVLVTTQKRKETARSTGDFPLISDKTGELIVPEIQSARVIPTGVLVRGEGIVTSSSANVGGNGFSVIEDILNNRNEQNIGNGSPQIRPSGLTGIGSGGNNSSNGLILGSGLIPVTTPRPSATPAPSSSSGFATPPEVIPRPGGGPIVTPAPTATPAPTPAPIPSSEPVVATPAPTATPEPNHTIDYLDVGNGANGSQYTANLGDLYIYRSSIEDRWDNGPSGKHPKMDYLNWQPIVALCCYYSTVTTRDWGSYGSEGTKYISYEKIKEIVDIFAFEYTYVQEVPRPEEVPNRGGRIMWEDYLKRDEGITPFKTTVGEPYQSSGKWIRMTERTPAYAPAKIANSYICYEYIYDRGTEIPIDGWRVDYSYIKEVKYHIQPSKLVEAIERVVPHFDDKMYLQMLRKLPNGEEFATYFEEEIFVEGNDELRTTVTSMKSDSPSIDVVTGSKNYSNYVNGHFDVYEGSGNGSGMDFGDDGYAIPLYAATGRLGGTYLNIRPIDELMVEGTDYGMYYLSEAAMAPLDVSDELSYIEIRRLLDNPTFLNGISNSPLLDETTYPGVRNSFAACLYNFQETYQASVCGLLGIMRQEGGFTSTITRRGWNYFNIKVTESQIAAGHRGTEGYSSFRDYKYDVETRQLKLTSMVYDAAPVEAFAEQMDFIYNLYWNGTRSGQKQNSFYKMIFVNYAKNGATGLQAYNMYPSYCPPYDDKAMPYSQDSYTVTTSGDGSESYHHFWRNQNVTAEGNRGWANNCAWWRVKYYRIAIGEE